MGSGVSKRQALEHAAKQLGVDVETLMGVEMRPAIPAPLAYLWEIFAELAEARQGTGMGPCPISHSDMASWSSLACAPLTAWEARLLRRIDALYMEVQHARSS